MRFSRHWLIATALGISVFGESMAYTFIQQKGDVFFYSSSILYLLAGIAVCILPLLKAGKRIEAGANKKSVYKLFPYLFFAFLIALFVYHIVLLGPLYKSFRIDVKWADMIPVIQLSCKRLLHGIPVYAPTPEIKPGSINAYLPMMWLPYMPAEVFGYDPRWTTVTGVFISLIVAALPLLKSHNKIELVPMCITCMSLFLVLNFFLFKYSGFWAMTEEGVIAAYYILLGFALLSENYYLTGFAMACCLLSRYSLIPWIPVYLAYLFFTQPRRNFMKVFVPFTSFVVLVFVVPYFIWDPVYFLRLPFFQASASNSFWIENHIQEHAYHNVGLFKFFKINQIGIMTIIELCTSFICPIVFIFIAKKLQQRYQLNSRYISYGSLKICLICFYNFIPAPYMYLFFPATLISYAILFDYLSGWQPEIALT